MKLNGIHTLFSYRYDIVTIKCTNQHQGGVAIIARRSRNWHLEDIERFGPNVIKTTLVYDNKRMKIIGAYIPLSEVNLKTNHHIEKAMINEDLLSCILVGDFNVNYALPKDERMEKIVDSLQTYNFIDLLGKFIKQRKKLLT